MFALVYNNVVIQIEANSFDVHPNYEWIACDNSISVGYEYENGSFVAPVSPVLTQEQILATYDLAIQEILDQTARIKQYSNSISCVSYINSSNNSWKGEANAFLLWRDSVFNYAIGIQAQVEKGAILPPLSAFIAGIPVMVWPD